MLPLFSENTKVNVNFIVAQFSRHRSLYFSIRNIFGFFPSNIQLYHLAIRHKSVALVTKNGFKHSNDRLEFLGDAVLSTAVASYLFRKFPFKDEGFLTEMRSRCVCRATLNQLALKIGLETLIICEPNQKVNNSIAGNTLEALLGAIYLDKGYAFTSKIIIDRILKFHLDIDNLSKLEGNFKSRLINWGQKNRSSVLFQAEENFNETQKRKNYLVTVLVDNEKYGFGEGYSKRKAEQDASEMACKKLQI